MAYQVALLNFEGPLHLLLQLIEQNELEITEISLARVTSQYLEHLRQLDNLDPAELNQFVELAAKLIHIKSQSLLPSVGEPEYQEDVAELTSQLEEYRKYQQAGRYLGELTAQGQAAWSRRAPKPIPNAELVEFPSVTAADLQAAFDTAIARMPRLPQEPLAETFTIEDAHRRIHEAVRAGQSTLQIIIQTAASRAEAVVLFLSLLELWRGGAVRVHQQQPFGDIMVING